MQDVQKKKRTSRPRGRLWLLLLVLMLLAGVTILWLQPSETEEKRATDTGYVQHLLSQRETSEVATITVSQRVGDGWTMEQTHEGVLTLQGSGDQPIDPTFAALLLDAASYIEASALLTDDPADYRAHLTDFGLDHPRAVVHITYTDGQAITLRIGDQITYDENYWMYMTVDDSDSLYAIDKGTADLYTMDGPLMLSVVQPVMHRQRFDSVTFSLADGTTLQWVLDGDVTNTDAQDRWFMTQPVTYPADAAAFWTLRQHIESLQLGAYVCPATEEALTLYGFDTPQMTLTVHQAAGEIGTTDALGELVVTAYPESTMTLVVGGAKSEDIDYVLYNGNIYISSHYALSALMNIKWRDTLSRYPVLTALGNLARLTVATDKGTTAFELTRTERVAENNDLVYDEDGQLVYDVVCTRNGERISYEAFEAAYSRLITVSVSGTLPEGWEPTESAHTTYTFEDVDGTVHTIALTKYDALHDAVVVNGQALFYLIQGGFALEME